VPRLHLASHRVVALAGSLIVFGSFAIGGHAATAPPQGLMRWAVPLHALCAAFWMGALPLLLSAVRNEAPERTLRLLRRFSAYSLVAVTLLVALGVAIAFVQVSHFAALWGTTYGLVLIGKIVAVAALLAGAAHNKWRASPLLALGSASVQSTFTRGVCAEYVLFAAILALTATLGQVQPPRAAAEQMASAGFTATRKQDDYTVTLTVAPARTGRNALSLAVTDNTGQPASIQDVALDLAFPAAGIAPLHRKATQDVSGRFAYVGDDFSVAGRWRVDATIVVDDLTKTTVSFDVPVR
jgi:copper transport protein